jgi:calcium/calmodulin-dependent protein kinase I
MTRYSVQYHKICYLFTNILFLCAHTSSLQSKRKLDDDDSHIRVADFGFARRVHAPNCLTSRCGSPTFVAPEILKNIPHDQRGDLWSVGVVIYLLLIGYPPFVKKTQAELFTQIRSCDWKFYEEDWENISPDARELIENILVSDPEQRWTASESL